MRAVSLQVGNVVKERYKDVDIVNGYKARTTNLFGMYNTFLFSAAPLHSLFKEISTLWNEVKPDDDIYYLQSWVNVYEETASIGWHYHWTESFNAWHGFYCVDVDVSKTTYALSPKYYQESKAHDYLYNGQPILEYNDEYELIDVVGQDNFLIMGRSAGDQHRNLPWKIKNRPRITIAFDIVPGRHIDNTEWENHWIPLV